MPVTFLNDDQAFKITLHDSVPFHDKNNTRKLPKTLTHLMLKSSSQTIIPPPRRQTRPRPGKHVIPKTVETTPPLLLPPFLLPTPTSPPRQPMQFPTRILILVRNRWWRRREPRTRRGGRRGCGDGAAARGARASAGGKERGLGVEGAEVVFESSGKGEDG